MIAGLANHLWQSTLFALAAAALAAALRGNRASVRHAIWVAASVKWLVPFAWLIAAGRAMATMLPATGAGAATVHVQPALSNAVRQLAEPFPAVEWSAPMSSAAAATSWLMVALAGLWACGVVAMAAMRLRGWAQVRAAIRQSAPLDSRLLSPGLDVRSAPGLLEPGVVGIWRPVLLLPAGIEDQLLPPHLESVVAHELCHVRRRDNLTAAMHMAVESAFWFHPLVWWIGARLIEERERACDEDVLGRGARPRDYAEGILRVCKLYVEAPIACVSGVTGSNLKRRIEDIMMNRTGRRLSVTRRLVLTGAAAFAVAAPLVFGATTVVRAQATTPAAAAAGPQSPAIGDLASVVKVARDPAATAADKERLIGKTFSGLVVVDAVRLYSPKAAIVMALPVGWATADKAIVIALRFGGKGDDEKLQQLRKGTNARLRGTLTRFSTEGKVVWVDFSDLVIEDPGGPIS